MLRRACALTQAPYAAVINFNTAVWADEETHAALELSRGVIARRYIFSGHAPVDLLCTVPWDLVAQTAAGADAGDGAGNGAGHAHRAKAARLLRLLTLMRVKRVLDAPDRLMQALRDSTGISHAATTLASLLLACFLLSHWLACALHLTAITQPSSCTWVQTYFNRLNGDAFADPCEPLVPMPSVGSIYIAALYWSVMTVTTVGYGDVAPYTDPERCMEIAGMLIGAVGYAVVIGAACGVVSQMSERTRALESALDTAGRLGASQAINSSEPLPAETLARVRGYLRYVHARGAAWAEGDAVALSARLSPALRAEVALARRGKTLRGAHVFFGASTAALAELSSALSLVTLPPGEVLIREGERCDRLSLLRHGLVLTVQSNPARMRHVTAGSTARSPEHQSKLMSRLRRRAPDVAPPPVTHVPVFGVETLWRNPQAAHAALTLTYTELNVITRDRLVSILDRHVSLKVSARVHALSCLLVETIRQLGVAHTQIKHQAMTARFKRHAAEHGPRIGAPQPPKPVRTRPVSPSPAAAPAPAEPASQSQLAPPHQLSTTLPPLPGAEGLHPGMVAAVAAFTAAASPRRGSGHPADGGLTTEQLREGWKIVTSSPQPQLNLTLLLDAVQSGDPELWPGLDRSVKVLQRYCRSWLLRKRLDAIHAYTQSSLARGSMPNPEAAMAVVNAPNVQAAAEADDAVTAEDVALVEAVSLALTPQLRAIAISIESLINDVQALRNERA
jgi:CRP-like cAMP-binding protein